MRTIICMTAAVAFGAWSAQASAKPFDIKHTSWAFYDSHAKAKVHESIDGDGNYIENAVSGKHIDHGTVVMKDKKACFTSAMTKDGEDCYTTPANELKIGGSFITHSDKGEKLKVTRIKYTVLKMPG